MPSNFRHFINKFPATLLPLTLSEADAVTFSAANEPLPHKLIKEFILPFELDFDDLTEYVPCVRIKGTKNFEAVIYWKASLMNYQYVLMTFDKKGIPIDKKVIAGTFSDGKKITRSVAQIDDDMSIYIISGQISDRGNQYDASQSTTIELELLPDGKLIELEQTPE